VAPLGPQPYPGPYTRPCVFISAGTYDGPFVLPPQICLMGEGYNHSRLSGNWSIDDRWSNYATATAAVAPNAVSIPVAPLLIAFPAGQVMTWIVGGAVTVLTAPALVGATTLSIAPLVGAIAPGEGGEYANDMRSSWINVGVFGDITVDFATVISNEGKLYAFGVRFGGNITIDEKRVFPVSNSLTVIASELFGDTTLGGIPTLLEGCVMGGGTLTLNQLVGSGVDNLFESSGGSLGNIVVNNLSGPVQAYKCKFGHSVQPGTTLTMNGPDSLVSGDISSIPLQTSVTLSGLATLDQIVRTNQPNWSGPTATRPTNVYIGLQFFDTSLGLAGLPIWYDGTNWITAAGVVV